MQQQSQQLAVGPARGAVHARSVSSVACLLLLELILTLVKLLADPLQEWQPSSAMQKMRAQQTQLQQMQRAPRRAVGGSPTENGGSAGSPAFASAGGAALRLRPAAHRVDPPVAANFSAAASGNAARLDAAGRAGRAGAASSSPAQAAAAPSPPALSRPSEAACSERGFRSAEQILFAGGAARFAGYPVRSGSSSSWRRVR